MHCCCVTKSCCLNWWSSYFQYVNSWCFSPFQPYCFNKGISHWLHTYSHNIMISILCHIVIFIKIAFAPKQSMNCSPWSTFFFGQNDVLRQIARQNVKDSGLKVEMRDPHIFFKDTISLLLKDVLPMCSVNSLWYAIATAITQMYKCRAILFSRPWRTYD